MAIPHRFACQNIAKCCRDTHGTVTCASHCRLKLLSKIKAVRVTMPKTKLRQPGQTMTRGNFLVFLFQNMVCENIEELCPKVQCKLVLEVISGAGDPGPQRRQVHRKKVMRIVQPTQRQDPNKSRSSRTCMRRRKCTLHAQQTAKWRRDSQTRRSVSLALGEGRFL